MLRRGSFTGTQRKTNQLKQVVGAPKPASSRLRILSQGTSRCVRHIFPLPLLHLLKLGKPEVRCLTRRPDSEAAKTLKPLGAQVVKPDLNVPASIQPVPRH